MSATALPIRAFQWDIARQIERMDWLLEQLPRYADWGYQELYLHLEDAVEYPSLPAVARKGAYTYRQVERLVARASRVGIKVVPIVNLLGHTQYLIKVPELRDLNELRHPDGSPQETGQICPLHPRTLEVAEKLLRDMAPFCTAGKVHVGLDESFHLGKHPLSQREVKRIGLAAHFAGHVQRLRKLTRSMDLRMGMWADMLYFLPDAIPLLPRDLIAYDWYYYPFKRVPRVELFNYAEFDLATPLRQRGIEYWGCPMNGAFRHEPLPHFSDRLNNAISWWHRCHKTNAAGFLMTSWEPNRLAMETTTLVDAAVSSLWQEPSKAVDLKTMLGSGVKKFFGTTQAQVIARHLLACDQYPFTGYARWEINKAWPLASGPENLSTLRRERSHYRDLQRSAKLWPAQLACSIAYRLYLAERDTLVREARDMVLRLRKQWTAGHSITKGLKQLADSADKLSRSWQAGHTAAQRMWSATRKRDSKTPNLLLLKADQQQFKAMQTWLRTCRRNPEKVMNACAVCGEWQLNYGVWNHAPAVQRIAADQWDGDTWRPIKTCHTIEFLGQSAARRSHIVHYHQAAAKDTTGVMDLRLRVGGTGTVKLSCPVLTNGVVTLKPADAWTGWRIFGKPPIRGWPDLLSEDRHELRYTISSQK